ncbi:MaoC/PaaZ C-terminal domain-containing protein [Streptomyces sp. NPDC059002]|uniref:MaoC family dehydratase n=1 Tax=Streptomyces sp. NPDC059002 TaxID=3346690 RepID=UPI003682D883
MPSVPLLLARAALTSPFKRPRPNPHPPRQHLTALVHIRPTHLTAYERLCGFPTDALPPTYPHVLAFPLSLRLMTARTFPLPLLGLVHTSIEITQHHPLHPTEPLQLDVHVTELTPHRRGTQATLATEARTTDGTLTWESRSTFLSRHKTRTTPERTEPEDGKEPTPPPTGAGAGAGAGTRTEWHLPADLGRRYASVSGDRNPIHLHPMTARPFGFPHPIAHGMWTAARCLAEHAKEDAPRTPHHTRIDFKAPVPLPSTVTYTSTGPAFALHSPTGKPHLTGTIAALP